MVLKFVLYKFVKIALLGFPFLRYQEKVRKVVASGLDVGLGLYFILSSRFFFMCWGRTRGLFLFYDVIGTLRQFSCLTGWQFSVTQFRMRKKERRRNRSNCANGETLKCFLTLIIELGFCLLRCPKCVGKHTNNGNIKKETEERTT